VTGKIPNYEILWNHKSTPLHQWRWNVGMGSASWVRFLPCAKFHLHGCTIWPMRGGKPIFGFVRNNNRHSAADSPDGVNTAEPANAVRWAWYQQSKVWIICGFWAWSEKRTTDRRWKWWKWTGCMASVKWNDWRRLDYEADEMK